MMITVRPCVRFRSCRMPEHVAGGRQVERTGGLVGEEELRPFGEGAGDGHALLLAAGHLGREMVRTVGEAHQFEGGGRVERMRGEFGRHLDVLISGQRRHQVVELEDEADLADGGTAVSSVVVHGRQVGVAVPDVAGGRTIHAADEIEQRALAGAGWARG